MHKNCGLRQHIVIRAFPNLKKLEYILNFLRIVTTMLQT